MTKIKILLLCISITNILFRALQRLIARVFSLDTGLPILALQLIEIFRHTHYAWLNRGLMFDSKIAAWQQMQLNAHLTQFWK